jgi:hypothetical protein
MALFMGRLFASAMPDTVECAHDARMTHCNKFAQA